MLVTRKPNRGLFQITLTFDELRLLLRGLDAWHPIYLALRATVEACLNQQPAEMDVAALDDYVDLAMSTGPVAAAYAYREAIEDATPSSDDDDLPLVDIGQGTSRRTYSAEYFMIPYNPCKRPSLEPFHPTRTDLTPELIGGNVAAAIAEAAPVPAIG